MTVLVEDTPRNNLAAWTCEAIGDGLVEGAVLSPFSSPWIGNTYKPSAQRIVAQLLDAGAEVWLDPASHALQMPGVGDFRYYDGWDLWGADRGDLSTPALRRDHALRVLSIQRDLGVGRLAPTVLLHAASGSSADAAFSLAEETVSAEPASWITIAGSPTFWAEDDPLDAFVGALAQLNPQGFFVVVVRPTADLPVAATGDEIAGLCRTARSLEQFGPVHISHGDLAALPAVAAGARSVGSGWDSRQRVCNYTSYVARDPAAGGGGWFKRPTFAGLFGFLGRVDAERFFAQDQALASRLHPGNLHPDGPKEAFFHHAAALSGVSRTLRALDFEPAYRRLRAAYEEAVNDWAPAAQAASVNSMAHVWVNPLLSGLTLYGESEGWL